jgi:hypothetical protein
MKVLLDACVDWRLSRDIVGHDVRTAQAMGWAATSNGELLALASQQFDVFVTLDRNLAFQQNLGILPMGGHNPGTQDKPARRSPASRCRSPGGSWVSASRSDTYSRLNMALPTSQGPAEPDSSSCKSQAPGGRRGQAT